MTIMDLFLTVAKSRLLPGIGWIVCSILVIFIGGLGGIFVGYLCLATCWIESTDQIFSGWTFLTFPYTGGFIGIAILHIIRIRCWVKLHLRYTKEHKEWTWKYTIGIALFDETIWLVIFLEIFALCVTVM